MIKIRSKHITEIIMKWRLKHVKDQSKLCKGANGIVAWLSPEWCETLLVFDTDTPCKSRTRKGTKKRGQTTLTRPANKHKETWHKTYANTKRSSRQNQRKKNQLVWSYDCRDMTVRSLGRKTNRSALTGEHPAEGLGKYAFQQRKQISGHWRGKYAS